MKLFKVLAIVLLSILAFKALMFLLGLASAALFILFWAAVIYVIGLIIWNLVGGKSDPLKLDMNSHMHKLGSATNSMRSHFDEFKRQVMAKR